MVAMYINMTHLEITHKIIKIILSLSTIMRIPRPINIVATMTTVIITVVIRINNILTILIIVKSIHKINMNITHKIKGLYHKTKIIVNIIMTNPTITRGPRYHILTKYMINKISTMLIIILVKTIQNNITLRIMTVIMMVDIRVNLVTMISILTSGNLVSMTSILKATMNMNLTLLEKAA